MKLVSGSWPHLKPAVLGVLFLLSLSALLMSGCALALPDDEIPTLIPMDQLPTVIALTAQAGIPHEPPTPQATPTETPQDPTEIAAARQATVTAMLQPTARGSLTPTPDVTETPPIIPTREPGDGEDESIPFAEIQFIRPGSLSKVVTPIDVHVFLRVGADGRVRVELYGEDGRLMYRKLFVYSTPGAMLNLFAEIDFEIDGVAEAGLLVVSVDDAEGRTRTLASEEVVLLSIGDAELNPQGDLLEPIVIRQPEARQLVQGGEVLVTGLARTGNDRPLLVELVDADGVVIGQRLAGLASDVRDRHRVFAAEVPYQVAAPTWVRLRVSVVHPQLGIAINSASIEILLGE